MVKVNAPLFGLDASGSLGGAIVFSNWKGRKYVRQLVKPTNPQSPSQTGIRAMMAFLSRQWGDVTVVDKASYVVPGEAEKVTSFNAFIKENIRAWREFFFPVPSFGAEKPTYQAAMTSVTAAGGQRSATVSWTRPSVSIPWGVAIFRGATSDFTANWNNCVKVIQDTASVTGAYVDSPLAPGTYFYRVYIFDAEINLLTFTTTAPSAVVT